MTRLIKYVAGAIAIVCTLFVLAIFWVLHLDPNEHKEWLSNKFQEQTGRQLSLDGDIAFSLYPWVGVSVQQVAIGDDPAFSDSPFLRTALAEVRLQLLPALRGEYIIDTVRLHDTSINLITTEAGNNWDSLTGTSMETAEQSAADKANNKEPLSIPRLTIGGIDIQGLDIHYQDRSQDTEYVIDDLSLQADELVYGEPLSFLMAFQASGSKPAFAADASLNATVTYDLDNETYAISPLQAEASLSGADLPAGYENMQLDSSINLNLAQNTLAIPTLHFSGLGNDINASLDARNLSADSLQLNGDLNASGPNLPLLLSLVGRLTGGTESPLATYGQALDQLNDKSFQAQATIDADLESGNLQLDIPGISSLGFTLGGNLQGQNIERDDGSFSGQLGLQGRNLKPVLQALELPIADALEALDIDFGLNGSRRNLQLQPLQATLNFSGDSVPNGSADITLQANPQLDLDQGTLDIPQYELSGLGLDISGSVSGSDILETPQFNGELQISEFNLRQLMQDLGLEPPITADNSTLQSLALEASFSTGPELSSIDPLLLTLDDTSVQGSAGLNTADNNLLSVALEIDSLNLDRYLPPPEEEEEDSSNNDEAGSGDIPVDSLRSLNMDGSIRIAELTISNLHLNNTELSATADNGRISLEPLGTDLYNGTYRGSIHLDVSGDTAHAAIAGDLSSVDMAPLLLDFMEADYLRGIANINLDLNSQGSDIDSLTRNLSGSGQLSLTDGMLKGVDIPFLLQQVERMIREKRTIEVHRGEQTPFDSFAGSLNINNGVITTNDLQMLAPGFRVEGNGTLMNLQDDSIDFNLLTAVDEATAITEEETYNIGGYQVPIACSGTISSPRCLPDLGVIIQAALSAEVERRVGDFLQRALGGDEEAATADGTDGATATEASDPEATSPEDREEQPLETLLRGLFE